MFDSGVARFFIMPAVLAMAQLMVGTYSPSARLIETDDDEQLSTPANTKWLRGQWRLEEKVASENATYDIAYVRCTDVEDEGICLIEVGISGVETVRGSLVDFDYRVRARLRIDEETGEVRQEWQSMRTGAWIQFALARERSVVKELGDSVQLRIGPPNGDRCFISKLHSEEDALVLKLGWNEFELQRQ